MAKSIGLRVVRKVRSLPFLEFSTFCLQRANRTGHSRGRLDWPARCPEKICIYPHQDTTWLDGRALLPCSVSAHPLKDRTAENRGKVWSYDRLCASRVKSLCAASTGEDQKLRFDSLPQCISTHFPIQVIRWSILQRTLVHLKHILTLAFAVCIQVMQPQLAVLGVCLKALGQHIQGTVNPRFIPEMNISAYRPSLSIYSPVRTVHFLISQFQPNSNVLRLLFQQALHVRSVNWAVMHPIAHIFIRDNVVTFKVTRFLPSCNSSKNKRLHPDSLTHFQLLRLLQWVQQCGF